MNKPRKNVPKEIWLQIGEDWDTEDFLEIKNKAGDAGITWCENKINDNDIRYILDKRQVSKRIGG